MGRVAPTGSTSRIITTSDIEGSKDVTFTMPAPPTPGEKRIILQTPSWSHYVMGVVALMNEGTPGIPPFEAVICTSVPLGGGLSSSAALEVSTCLFVEKLCHMSGINLPQRSNEVIY